MNCMFGIEVGEAVSRAKGKDYCEEICGDLKREHLTRHELEHQIARTSCTVICRQEKRMRERF